MGAVPGSSFFREPVNHLIRLHFAKNDDTINEAKSIGAKVFVYKPVNHEQIMQALNDSFAEE